MPHKSTTPSFTVTDNKPGCARILRLEVGQQSVANGRV